MSAAHQQNPPLTEPLLNDDEEHGTEHGRRTASLPPSPIGGTASLTASLANVLIAVLGAGQLTLPYVMSQCGLLLGLVLLVFFAGVAAYSSELLRYLSAATKSATYGDMLAKTLGPRWRGWSNGVVSLYAFGTAVSFMIIMLEELHRVADFFAPTTSEAGMMMNIASAANSFFGFGFSSGVGDGDGGGGSGSDGGVVAAEKVPWEENKRLLLVIVTAVIVWPLSLLRDLSMLRFTSVFGAFAAVYITAVVWAYAPFRMKTRGVISMDVCGGDGGRGGGRGVVHGGSGELGYGGGGDGGGGVTMGKTTTTTPLLWPESVAAVSSAVPLLSFALNSGWAFVPIYSTMRDPTPARGSSLIARAHVLILVNYLAMASIGYLSFCDGVVDNVVDNLPVTAVPVLLARVALILQLCCGLPIRFHVTAGMIVASLRGGAGATTTTTTGGTSCCGSLRWMVTQTCLVGSSLLFACLLTKLHVVVGLSAAVCASCIVYIFPGLAYYNLVNNNNDDDDDEEEEEGEVVEGAGEGDDGDEGEKASPGVTRRVVMPLSLAILGGLVMVAGTTANVADALRGGGHGG